MSSPLANNRIKRGHAEKEASARRSEADERLKISVEYAQAGLKGIFIANGGAILSLLTFLGNSNHQVDVRGVFWSFIWFVIGLSSVLGAYLAAYFSQTHFMQAAYDVFVQQRNFSAGLDLGTAPTEEKNEKKKRSAESKGFLALRTAVILVVIALLMFIVGAFVALAAIT